MKNNFLELFEKCDEKLKALAFTHSSYAHDKGCESNERVEFLGDSVLSTIVSDYLFKNLHDNEGKMTKIRATFVCTESLAELARKLGIEKRIMFGKSFAGSASDAVLADTIESMIAVMYLSYGMHSIAGAVLEALDVPNKVKHGLKPTDYKSSLQEYAQSVKQKLKYEIETYLTKGGQQNFRAAVMLEGQFVAYGQGSTKREAEQNAAKLTIEKLRRNK